MKPMIDEERVRAGLRGAEKAFPIYRIKVQWSEAYPPGAEEHIHRAGQPPLPEGRFWNGTSWDVMEREERPVGEIVEERRRKWWPEYVEHKKLLETGDLTITVTLLGRDVWCPGWFSHWTFDVGLSNRDVLGELRAVCGSHPAIRLVGHREGRHPHGSRGPLPMAWLHGRRSARRTHRGTLPLSGLQKNGIVRIDH